VLAVRVVNVPAAGVETPMAVASIAPELMSTDVSTDVPETVAEAAVRACRLVDPVRVSVPPTATFPDAEMPPERNMS
jgi:hypothetical protein